MEVKIFKRGNGSCRECYFGEPNEPCGNYFAICEVESYKIITAAEFNASTGKKWRVKKDGRVIDYE